MSTNAVLAVCALALLSPLVAGQFDLPVGSNIRLSALGVAALLDSGTPPPVAVIGGILMSTAVGAFNGEGGGSAV